MELNESRSLAARILARTGSAHLAARKTGVELSLIRAWERDPEFVALILDRKSVNVVRTLSALIDCGPKAIAVLKQEMSTAQVKKVRIGRPPKDNKYSPHREKEPDADPRRIRAAKIIVENFFRAAETADLVERIKTLEAALRRQNNDLAELTE